MEHINRKNIDSNDNSNRVDNEDSLDRTQFLLARLQELKAWQKDQEEKLLRDQEEQMDQLACLPINQLGINANNVIDNNAHGMRGLDYVNANENMAWADIRRINYAHHSPMIKDTSPSIANSPQVKEKETDSTSRQEPNDKQNYVAEVDEKYSTVKSNISEFDERPVMTNTKTFEQLLAEKLKLEEQAAVISPVNHQTPDNTNNALSGNLSGVGKDSNEEIARSTTPASTGAKPFLRRGSGLARYGGISGSPKGVLRRRSNHNVSPYSQLKRSTSTSAVPQSKDDKKEDTQLPTPTTSMKQSKSCSKISNSASKPKPKSPTRRHSSQANRNEVNSKRPPKTLKLNSMKKKINEKTIYESNLDKIGSGDTNLYQVLKEQQRQENASANERPRTYNKNDSEGKFESGGKTNPSEEIVGTHKMLNSMTAMGAYDSVELSFMEKLDKANKRHSREMEDLATFEMLEDRLATTDSSICSSIAGLKIVSKSKPEEDTNDNNGSPSISPVLSRHPFADAASATSTPLSNKALTEKIKKSKQSNTLRGSEIYKRQLEGSVILEERDTKQDELDKYQPEMNKILYKDEVLDDPIVNHNLMQDIKNFLESNNGVKEGERIQVMDRNSNDHDTEEDDTLKDDAIDGIPSDDESSNKFCNGSYRNGPRLVPNTISDEQISDNSIEIENRQNLIAKNVRFHDKLTKKNPEVLTFSPPRIPKNSPSYLIWSIFTKEREERNRQQAAKLRADLDEDEEWQDLEENEEAAHKSTKYCPEEDNKACMIGEIPYNKATKTKRDNVRQRRRSESPLSRISSKNKMTDINDDIFCDTLFNAKLVELNKEVEAFKKENANLQTSRRRLNADRKQLAKDIEEFERNKDIDKKKIEEDRKRLRREKAMFEKSQKEKKVSNDRKSQDEIEELQMKLQKLNEELNRKETKWALALSKLQEQVKFLERENQQLHEENHKLKLKGVSAKVSSHLIDPTSRRVYSASNSVQGLNSPMSSSKASSNQLFYNSGKALSEVSKCNSVESGMRPESISSASPMHSNNLDPESHLYTHTENDVNHDELEASRLMAFSPAESLESNVTLVSAGISDPSSRAVNDKTTAKCVQNGGSIKIPKDIQAKDSCQYQSQNDQHFSQQRNEIKKVEKTEKSNDKVVKYYTDGSIEICCTNGHRKEISPDGKNTKVFYNNGDIKETLPNGLVKYFYSGVKTWHFKYQDGREVTQFNNGKTETKFPDGTVVIDEANGDSVILLPNGQKEEHTSQYKKREYPDGTVKIVYEDGRQETRYSSGRIRKKDTHGNLIFDSEMRHDQLHNENGSNNLQVSSQSKISARISSQIGKTLA